MGRISDMLLTLLFITLVSGEGWDYIVGFDNNFSPIVNTGKGCWGFDSCHQYLYDLFARSNVQYVAVYLHEHNGDSAFCDNINNSLPAKLFVFGVSADYVFLNNTASNCDSFSQCLEKGCNMPFNATAYVFTSWENRNIKPYVHQQIKSNRACKVGLSNA